MAKNKKSFLLDELSSLKPSVTVLEELKAYITPLSKDERKQLEDNLLAEGIRDPLIVWKRGEELVLVDGHNRFEIAQKHGLPYEYSAMSFEDLDKVKDWMINNQLGRRNLTPEQQSYYRGLQYKSEKNKQGGTGLNQYSSKEEEGRVIEKTAERLAQKHKVSEKTIRNDEKYAEALDKIAEAAPELRRQVLDKSIAVSKNTLIALANMDKHAIEKAAKELQEGRNLQMDIPRFKTAWDTVLEKVRKKDKKLIPEIIVHLQEIAQESK